MTQRCHCSLAPLKCFSSIKSRPIDPPISASPEFRSFDTQFALPAFPAFNIDEARQVNGQDVTTELTDLTWRCVATDAELLELQEKWELLFDANPSHSPFLAFGWTVAWLRHLAGEHVLRILILEDASGALHVVLPLITTRRPGAGGRMTLTNICGYGADCSDHLGCLFLPQHETALIELVFNGISRFFAPNIRIELNSLNGHDRLSDRFELKFKQAGRYARPSLMHHCPSLALPDSWEDLLKSLSKNFRSQVRRNINAVMKHDELDTRLLEPEEARSFTEDLIRLNRNRMDSTGRTSSLEDETLRAFLVEAVPYMADKKLAWMDVVEDSDRVLAGSLNFIHGKSIYYYMGGFSDEIVKKGPGNVLFAEVLQRGIENQYERFDFLRGDETYKYRWGAKDIVDQNLIVSPGGLARGYAEGGYSASYLFLGRSFTFF